MCGPDGVAQRPPMTMLLGMKNAIDKLRNLKMQYKALAALAATTAITIFIPGHDFSSAWGILRTLMIGVFMFFVHVMASAETAEQHTAKFNSKIEGIRERRDMWLGVMHDDDAAGREASALVAWRHAYDFESSMRMLGINENVVPEDPPGRATCPCCKAAIRFIDDHVGGCDLARSLHFHPPTVWPAVRHGVTVTEAMAKALVRTSPTQLYTASKVVIAGAVVKDRSGPVPRVAKPGERTVA